MNILLLEDKQFRNSDSALANPRQAEHIKAILKLEEGSSIQIGQVNGAIGKGIIRYLNDQVFIDEINLDQQAPSPLPLTLVLAMPRPQMLKRIVQTSATMGVKRLYFLQTSRVEKSFWQSPSATDEKIRELLLLGLEQGVATHMPEVRKYQRFRPFMEDELPGLTENSLNLIAHPGATNACKELTSDRDVCLAIGPEGGFLDKEVEKFFDSGFEGIHLGQRILRVETAVTALLAKLFPY